MALYEPLMFIVGDMILNYTGTGYVQGRVGNGTGSASPRGVYQAADGKWLSIAASNQGIAKRLFAAMGRPELIEDPRYATNAVRMEQQRRAPGDRHGLGRRAPAGRDPRRSSRSSRSSARRSTTPATSSQDPHFLERTLVELTGGDGLGGVLMPGPVLHLQASYDGPSYDGVPAIGEHTEQVLAALLDDRPGRAGCTGRSGRDSLTRVR